MSNELFSSSSFLAQKKIMHSCSHTIDCSLRMDVQHLWLRLAVLGKDSISLTDVTLLMLHCWCYIADVTNYIIVHVCVRVPSQCRWWIKPETDNKKITHCVWRILVVCIPQQHHYYPSDHHTQCPSSCFDRPPHVLHWAQFRQSVWCHHWNRLRHSNVMKVFNNRKHTIL